MNLAMTFNLKRSAREEEAEFDTQETIDALAAVLRGLGHRVVPVDVSTRRSPSEWSQRPACGFRKAASCARSPSSRH